MKAEKVRNNIFKVFLIILFLELAFLFTLFIKLLKFSILQLRINDISGFIDSSTTNFQCLLVLAMALIIMLIALTSMYSKSKKKAYRPKYNTVVYYFEDGVTKILSRDVYADSGMKAYDMMIDYACFSDWRGQGAGIGYRGITGYEVNKIKE